MTLSGKKLAKLAASFGDTVLTGGGGDGSSGSNDRYRFGVYNDDDQNVTFTRVKFAEASGPDFKDSDFNDRDDMIPVSVETFDFDRDQWKIDQSFMGKVNSSKHRFMEDHEFIKPGESRLLHDAREAYKNRGTPEKISGLDNIP